MEDIVSNELMDVIEQTLLEDASIKQAKIIDLADPEASYQDLVLAFTLNDSSTTDDDEDDVMCLAYETLVAKLDQYGGESVVPENWERCDFLPLDVCGDVDEDALRRSLLGVEDGEEDDDVEGEEAEEPTPESTEDKIMRVIASSLRVPPDQLNRQISFLQNGGDSLMAIQVFKRLMMEDVSLRVPELMRAESLDELPSLVIARHPPPMVVSQPATATTSIQVHEIRLSEGTTTVSVL